MHTRFHTLSAWLIVWFGMHSAAAKQIHLLGGQLSFDTPIDVSQSHRVPRNTDRYSILADLASPDTRFSVCATYGKHYLQAPDIARFLQLKVESYTKPN